MKQLTGKKVSEQTIVLHSNSTFSFCDLRNADIVFHGEKLEIIACLVDGLQLDICNENSIIVLETNLCLDPEKEVETTGFTTGIKIEKAVIDEDTRQLFEKVLTPGNSNKGIDNQKLLDKIAGEKLYDLIPLLGLCYLNAGDDWEIKTQIIGGLSVEFRDADYQYRTRFLEYTYSLIFDEEYMVRDFTQQLVKTMKPTLQELHLDDREYINQFDAVNLIAGLSMLSFNKAYYREIEDELLIRNLKNKQVDTIIGVIKIMNAKGISKFNDLLIAYIEKKEYLLLPPDEFPEGVVLEILYAFRESDLTNELSFYERLLTYDNEDVLREALQNAYYDGYENSDLIEKFIMSHKNEPFVKDYLKAIE